MTLDRRALAAALLLYSCVVAAAQESERTPPVQREIIPGSELMTSGERERYRQRMRAAGSPDAQARVREEHVKQLRQRARLRGLELADPNKKDKP